MDAAPIIRGHSAGGFAMPRALLVDDEPGIRIAMKRWFERQGFVAVEAADGNQALAHLMSAIDLEPDIIVCDIHLPGLSGDELLKRLCKERPALVDRVILTTGDIVDFAEPGSVLARHPFVLQKPFELAMLKTMVDRVRVAA
jgi:CheY-like chemotaxis protein